MVAYDKKKLFDDCCKAARDNNLFFIGDVCDFTGISKPTFYKYFDIDSNEFNEINNILNRNRAKTKSALRAKMYNSMQTGQVLALYKLICSPEERQMLSQNYVDITSNGQGIANQQAVISVEKDYEDELERQ